MRYVLRNCSLLCLKSNLCRMRLVFQSNKDFKGVKDLHSNNLQLYT